ncbi:precorrin-6A/cobalt-precorrin-6A reductase [Actinomadura madurae]|uniref:Precorrin-6A/cobalt-precorrin-6A reductase n=1 Tax=Actinomadura madurae TaxID=1993 RepID=A0A1I5IFP3_9ACTN|nr:cobalt-precorrin-6A reductase [Actinomadura madurae]SFO59407.1 precorrin-6A/cobalt-precorrin-6A reductase [Actinomadura madurae]
MRRVLILGGTAEARALAASLTDVHVVSSLAGRVSDPRLPVGEVHIGGFGGAEGLAAWLREHRIDRLVDATHPFAERMSASAARASEMTGVPLLALRRPGWHEEDGDDWRRVPSLADAARALADDARVFLTTGRRGIPVFAARADAWFLARSVDPPEPPVPSNVHVLLARGPYTVDGERALIREHRLNVLVTKDSGGAMTRAKLTAAREAGIPVLMVDRPPLPAGVRTADDVAAAAVWVQG